MKLLKLSTPRGGKSGASNCINTSSASCNEARISSFAVSLFISNLPSVITSEADFFLLNNIQPVLSENKNSGLKQLLQTALCQNITDYPQISEHSDLKPLHITYMTAITIFTLYANVLFISVYPFVDFCISIKLKHN